MKKVFRFLVIVVISHTMQSQNLKELYNQSVAFYKVKDYSNFLIITRKLDSLRPSHPTYTYNLACAYALNNDVSNGLNTLKNVILMNNKTSFEDEPDLESLKNFKEFDDLVELKKDLNLIKSTSKKSISLSEKMLHPEGLCYLKKSKTWLATSIRNRKIVSFDSNTGQCHDWLKTNEMLAIFAIKPDSQEKYLWVSTDAMPEMIGYSQEFEGKAAVLKIDIQSKEIVKQYSVEGNHVYGELAIAKNNTVYVSDSGKAIIYKIENDRMTEFLNLEKEAFNLQGITFNEDESLLFIADYFRGILAIPMSNLQNRQWLKFPRMTSFKGIDGLVYFGNSLIAIHNGVKPIRLIRYYLNSEHQITSYKILDHNRPEFDEPAQAIIVDNKLYYFANCPWNAYDSNFNLDATQFENPKLFELILE